jgi:serine/threonine protein kinase
VQNFASAEILEGRPYCAPQAEVWALGVLLCLLVVGETPFDSPERATSGKLSVQLTGLSLDLRDLLYRCFAVRPEERITIHEVLTHPWVQQNPDDVNPLKRRPTLPQRMQRAASFY